MRVVKGHLRSLVRRPCGTEGMPVASTRQRSVIDMSRLDGLLAAAGAPAQTEFKWGSWRINGRRPPLSLSTYKRWSAGDSGRDSQIRALFNFFGEEFPDALRTMRVNSWSDLTLQTDQTLELSELLHAKTTEQVRKTLGMQDRTFDTTSR